VEPQATVYHKGEQQPGMQLFLGLTLQWKKPEKATSSALAGVPGGFSRFGPAQKPPLGR